MKRIASLTLTLLVLASGLHLSVASHYCGGILAQVKWSVDGELASCGMEGDHQHRDGSWFEAPCCSDELAAYTTDGQYVGQQYSLPRSLPSVSMVFVLPAALGIPTDKVASSFSHVFPPGPPLLFPARQEDLCVFRI